MNAHPIADLFPMFGEMELQNLTDDIRENGLKDPIVTYENKILDGRNRFAACAMAAVVPRMKEYQGKDPLGYVLSKNLHRRHLTTKERAEIAVKISTMSVGRPKTNGSDEPAPMSQSAAAKALKVSPSSVKRAKRKLAPAPKNPPKRDASDGWTMADLKEDEELAEAFDTILKVYGEQDTKAIQKGVISLRRVDVMLLARLPVEKMRQLQDLIIVNRWTPAKAMDFINAEPEFLIGTRAMEVLNNLCLATNGKCWRHETKGFAYQVRATTAVKR